MSLGLQEVHKVVRAGMALSWGERYRLRDVAVRKYEEPLEKNEDFIRHAIARLSPRADDNNMGVGAVTTIMGTTGRLSIGFVLQLQFCIVLTGNIRLLETS